MAKSSKPRKEAFFVRVADSSGNPSFFNATEYVGRIMPFKKPQATCAMRVTDGSITFSLLHTSKRNVASLASKPVTLPKGPIARLERRALQYADLGVDDLVVELSHKRVAGPDMPDWHVEGSEGDEAAPKPESSSNIDVYRLKMSRDANGVVTVDAADGDVHLLELPPGVVNLSLYLKSPTVNMPVAVGFIGHLGRPGNSESIERLAGMVLNSMSHLTEFRVLAQMETVSLPPAPYRPATPKRREDEKAWFPVKVYLFSEELAPVAAGDVVCEFDLDNANPSSGKLLVKYHPEPSLAEFFEPYARQMDAAVQAFLQTQMDEEEIAQITYDIILGSVDAGTAERLRDTGKGITAVDMTPSRFKPHVDVEPPAV